MASSSSSSSSRGGTWRYNAFTSFHGPDVRKTFLSHLRRQFNYKGITMFDDEKIERSAFIAPALTQAIRESRISIVVLSKQYASSSWCLDELLEIMKCKEDLGQIVMTVFYGVDPSDVRKQNGEFGIAFNKTCAERTEMKIGKWIKALTDVGNIAGEDFLAWKNEAEMIEKIANDISNKLNATPTRDFDGMVGIEAHLREMESRLEFNNDGVKIVAISGPAGIGKTTIARALHSRHSNNFHLNCFIDNLRGYDEYALREQLLSKVLNLNGIRICHSGLIQERLHDQKVLIVLDDVQSLNQLEALADIRWYGPGSRIIVTTEDKEILLQHGINEIYHVSFPSKAEALMIFCLSAFRQTSPPDGFLYLANEVISICGNLPLGLKVLGSSLKGKSLDDWELELPRLKDSLDGKIENVLQVGYESLNERDQVIFLCTAIFFNGERVDDVTSMLDVRNLNAKLGLKILANRYLIQHVGGVVEMHHLLQLLARQVISRQDFPKRQILVNPHEISYVLEKAKGNESIVGISFDMTEVMKLIMSTKAFERMFNLLFLKVYNVRWRLPILPQLHIPEEMEFPPRLRLLHWEDYPRKSLPLGFCSQNLVKLDMRYSRLEKLWEGNQPLVNLKEMNFSCSVHLKKLPDLSTATNLEILDLYGCSALVEIPSLIANFHKLSKLLMDGCKSLEVIPTLDNMTSLEGYISMKNCSKLRVCPDIPTSTKFLTMKNTAVEELPASLTHCSSLRYVDIYGSGNLKTFLTHLPTSVYQLDLSNSGIERINTDCIQGLHNLHSLYLSNCKRLVSLPKLPSSLEHLMAVNCESLERVSEPLNTPKAELNFTNCFNLSGPHARQVITKESFLPNFKWGSYFGGSASLPGRNVPEEFVHRTTRSSLTIPPSTFNRVKGCILVSPNFLQDIFSKGGHESDSIFFDCKINGNLAQTVRIGCIIQAEHLLIFGSDFLSFDPSKVSTKIELHCSVYLEVNNDVFEYPLDKVEWGIQILTEENEASKNGGSGNYSMDTLEFNEVPGEEDHEEGSKSESGQASKDKNVCIVDAYESVSRKRLREKTITSSDTNVFLQGMAIQETGQCSSAVECSSLEGIAKGGDYKLLSRKRQKKTTFTSSTTTRKRVIQRRRTKKKKNKLNHKSFEWSRSFRIALLLRSRRKPAPL